MDRPNEALDCAETEIRNHPFHVSVYHSDCKNLGRIIQLARPKSQKKKIRTSTRRGNRKDYSLKMTDLSKIGAVAFGYKPQIRNYN